MRCISKHFYKRISVLLITSALLSGCGNSIDFQYDLDSSNDAFIIKNVESSADAAKYFAQNLCVSENDLNEIGLSISQAEAGGLFDVTNSETVYAKNIYKQMNPASLTKVMTAYMALKYGHLEDVLVASSNVKITESGATLVGINPGDKMTLSQALNALLIYSANDAAVMIAEYLSGSVDEFAGQMNKEALALGATKSHFVNPHGLTDEQHYTTVYDLYLIFNEAIKYDEFRKIINTPVYTLSYKDSEGNSKTKEIENTNKYINGSVAFPAGVNVIGGKTGTTKAAGACLILVANGESGHTYISVILHSDDHETVYKNMTDMLNIIDASF